MCIHEEHGFLNVLCDEELFGTQEIKLRYFLWQQETEDLSENLQFVQKHFKEMYQAVLEGVFIAYNKSPKWDVWDEKTDTFSRIEFHDYKEIHNYIGTPTIDVMLHRKKILFGLSFYRGNRLSMEHGLTAVLENCKLLLIDSDDFCNILCNWDLPGGNAYIESLYIE